MGQGLFIPLVLDSIIIIRLRSVYTFGSCFAYKCWVGVLSKIWILVFLGKYSSIVCWISKCVDWGLHHSNIVCWVSICVDYDANLNRHALRPNKNIGICCEPQSTRFETQQKYWNTCPRKLKFKFLIEPWPNVYKWNANQMYKQTLTQLL